MTDTQKQDLIENRVHYGIADAARNNYDFEDYSLGVSILHSRVQDDVHTCYIPLFNIHYTALSRQEIKETAKGLINSYLLRLASYYN
jgi:hypothetical protein